MEGNEFIMDRIEIFNQLSMDEFQNLNMERSKKLIGSCYDQFNSFCNYLKNETRPGGSLENIVKSVSCDMTTDTVEFSAFLCDGSEHKIHFDTPDDQ